MKRIWQGLIFVVCLFVFFLFRFHLLGDRGESEPLPNRKPTLPLAETTSLLISHPWLALQPHIHKISPEIIRDFAVLEEFCGYVESQELSYSPEMVTQALIETLTSLQKEIPFSYSTDYYNVLCLPEPNPPVSYQIYQRLYLGDSELGFPFYLEVRRYSLKETAAREVLASYLDSIEGEKQEYPLSTCRKAYLCKGSRPPIHNLSFAAGERGLFLDTWEEGETLFVAYAEAPWATFSEHLPFLKQMIGSVDSSS
ncbi:MAG: hypothetical protein K940chlam9_00875 [Chlamydiae bacterium]|nr:hypothetical protein [Chlamydiota bacterium]